VPDKSDKPEGAPRPRENEDSSGTNVPELGDLSADGGEENDRPTVSPPFDPVAFARDLLKPSPAPMRAVAPPAKSPSADAHNRVTPARGTEQQAVPVRAAEPRRKTPTSTISLLNARIPSNLPPRPGSQTKPAEAERRNADGSIDSDLPTRPPPPDSAMEDPFLEVSQDRASLPDLEEVEPIAEVKGQQATNAPRSATGSEPRQPARPPAVEMNARIELGDYSGALEIAEEILEKDPTNLSARACAETCRSVLRQMYAARIGPLDGVPVVMVPRDQLRWLSIDHKAGFVLSLVDGVSNLEMIIDVSGMPELDTLRILSELAQQRIISLR
jgi:hypothetical protein